MVLYLEHWYILHVLRTKQLFKTFVGRLMLRFVYLSRSSEGLWYHKADTHIWKFLYITSNQTTRSLYIGKSGTIITDPNKIPNEFNDFFVNIGPKLASKIQSTGKQYYEYLNDSNKRSVFMKPIVEDEILKIISKFDKKFFWDNSCWHWQLNILVSGLTISPPTFSILKFPICHLISSYLILFYSIYILFYFIHFTFKYQGWRLFYQYNVYSKNKADC